MMAVVLSAVLVLGASDPPDGSAVSAADLAVTALAGAGWLGLALKQSDWGRTRCPCERGSVNSFDRPAVRMDFSPGESLATLTAGLVFLGGGVGLLMEGRTGFALWEDVTLATQSAMLAGFATQVTKLGASRPYPYMYGPAPHPEQNHDGINYASFWSGHTAVPMAAWVFLATRWTERYPRSGWRWFWWTVGPALAVASGPLQMTAGNHFPTDVAAGAAAGALTGFLNARLHTW